MKKNDMDEDTETERIIIIVIRIANDKMIIIQANLNKMYARRKCCLTRSSNYVQVPNPQKNYSLSALAKLIRLHRPLIMCPS